MNPRTVHDRGDARRSRLARARMGGRWPRRTLRFLWSAGLLADQLRREREGYAGSPAEVLVLEWESNHLLVAGTVETPASSTSHKPRSRGSASGSELSTNGRQRTSSPRSGRPGSRAEARASDGGRRA